MQPVSWLSSTVSGTGHLEENMIVQIICDTSTVRYDNTVALWLLVRKKAKWCSFGIPVVSAPTGTVPVLSIKVTVLAFFPFLFLHFTGNAIKLLTLFITGAFRIRYPHLRFAGLWIRIRIGSGFRDFVDPDPDPGARNVSGKNALFSYFLTKFYHWKGVK
jgi:hypothetical protein